MWHRYRMVTIVAISALSIFSPAVLHEVLCSWEAAEWLPVGHIFPEHTPWQSTAQENNEPIWNLRNSPVSAGDGTAASDSTSMRRRSLVKCPWSESGSHRGALKYDAVNSSRIVQSQTLRHSSLYHSSPLNSTPFHSISFHFFHSLHCILFHSIPLHSTPFCSNVLTTYYTT